VGSNIRSASNPHAFIAGSKKFVLIVSGGVAAPKTVCPDSKLRSLRYLL
jgi:hypothetical protein